MAHVKRFRGIPMSKTMRCLCKEEDYAFLGESEKMTEEVKEDGKGAGPSSEDDWRVKRIHRRLQQEQQEAERLRQVEEAKKEKQQQWQSRVERLQTSSQQKTLQERLERLKTFREFQRQVLAEESGTEDRQARPRAIGRGAQAEDTPTFEP